MTRRLWGLLILAAALPAAADTYKWVDARGVVNYSNAPPPESAKSGQKVEERISVMGMDPTVRQWAERRFAEQARAEEADWQMRQQAIRAQQSSPSPPMSAGYGDYGYAPYYYGGTYYATAHYRRPAYVQPYYGGGQRSMAPRTRPVPVVMRSSRVR